MDDKTGLALRAELQLCAGYLELASTAHTHVQLAVTAYTDALGKASVSMRKLTEIFRHFDENARIAKLLDETLP